MNINTPKNTFPFHSQHLTQLSCDIAIPKAKKTKLFSTSKKPNCGHETGASDEAKGPRGGLALILFLTYEFWYMYHLLMRHEAPAPSCKFRMQRSRKMQVDLSLSRTRGSDAIYRRNIKCSVYRVCHKNYYNMLGGVCVVLFLHVRYARTVRVHFAKSEYCDD